jgi:hypothetical protein
VVEGVVDSPENLVGRFKISRRLAVRIGALVGVGVQVSPTLLEEAVRKAPVEDLLLSDALLEAARGGLDPLRAFLAGAPELALAGENGNVVALAEELIAERVLPVALRPPGGLVPAPRLAPTRNLPYINELLLSATPDDEEIRAAKIKFLTGRDADERLEALRKILLSHLTPAEKAGILFFALRDEEHLVIGEAIKAFKEIGLSATLADALVELIRGSPAKRSETIEMLVREASSAKEKEGDVLVAVMGRLLRDEEFQPFKARLLKVLRALLRGREGAPEEIREMVRLLVRHVPPDLEDAQITLRELFLSLAKGRSQDLSEALWEEIDSPRIPAQRTFLLSLIGRIETRKAGLDKLDRILVEEEIPQALERGGDLSPFRYVLQRRCGPLFPRLLAMARDMGEERRAVVFRALAEALGEADLTDAARVHQARSLLTLAERSGKLAHRAILRAGIHRLPGLQPALRRRFASLHLSLLEPEFFLEHNREVWAALRELGWCAFEPLADFVASEANDIRLRRESLAILKEFLTREEAYPADEKTVARFVARMRDLSDNHGFSLRNEVTPLLGAALLNGRVPRREVDRIAARLVRRLREGYEPGDVGALPFLARSPRVDPDLKERMIRRLLRILDEGEQARVTRESSGDGGRLLEILEGGPIHTQQIPAAIEALQEAAVALGASDPGPAYMIARTFMRRWEEIVRWERVWGLASREALLRALGEMARSPAVAPTLAAEIFVFLARHFLARPLEPYLAEAVVVPLHADRFEKTVGIGAKILRKLLEVVEDPESVGPSDAGRYLLAAAHVASAPHSPVLEGPDRALAARLLEYLERRVRLGFVEDRQALDLIAEAAGLPRKIREKAESILALRARMLGRPEGPAPEEA